MKFSGVKCLAVCLMLIPLAWAEKDATKELKLNETEETDEDGGRFIKKKIIPCISTSGTGTGTGGVDTSGLSGIFTMISSSFSSLIDMFDFQTPDLSSLSLPNLDISSISGGAGDKLALAAFTKLKIPAIFFLSLIVGVIAAAITIAIPSKFQPEKMMQSMVDSISNFMQSALMDVPAQYGIPMQDYSQGYSQQGYSQQQDGYPQQQGGYPQQQEGGYGSGGYPAPTPAAPYGAPAPTPPAAYGAPAPPPAASYGAPASFDTSSNYQGQAVPGAPVAFDTTSFQQQGQAAPATFDSSSYQVPAAGGPDASFGAPAGNPSGFNSPSNAYPDPSTQYGTPHRRYNYPTLSSNYLRSEKSRK